MSVQKGHAPRPTPHAHVHTYIATRNYAIRRVLGLSKFDED